MAIKEIAMPHLGESVTAATIVKYLVKSGDRVKRYDPLMEVSSDKVVTEVPSDFEGTVKELLLEENVEVPIGAIALTLETEGQEAALPRVEEEKEIIIPTQSNTSKKEKNNGHFSPAVVKIANEKGIDLAGVTGTGKGGRVSRKDVLNFSPEVDQGRTTEAVVANKVHLTEQVAPVEALPLSILAQDTVVVPDPIRRAIASKMVQSVTEIPHAWMMVEADVTNVVNLRNKVKETFKQQEGISLSFFPFFAKAVIQAIKRHPKINTSWEKDTIVFHKDINLSIAITTDDYLFVPVILQADNYSVAGLAKQIQVLATSARQGTLTSRQMQGGTFTLNNTGSIGSVQSMGIINYPQAAILQVEFINKRVIPTKDGGFKVADIVNLCLSMDHRILDGQQGGAFLKDVKENLARFADEMDIY